MLPSRSSLRDILQQRGADGRFDAHDGWRPSTFTCAASSRAARTRTRLISIHLNAFGDGVNPFPNVGTSTLYFHPQTEPLARLVQAGMMREMGLRDLGVHYQNIAIGRTMWMPSLICEGAFLMVPEQENAVKTPDSKTATPAASPTASKPTFARWCHEELSSSTSVSEWGSFVPCCWPPRCDAVGRRPRPCPRPAPQLADDQDPNTFTSISTRTPSPSPAARRRRRTCVRAAIARDPPSARHGRSRPKSFGGKHHSTVIHSIRKINEMRKRDGNFNNLIHNFMETFR